MTSAKRVIPFPKKNDRREREELAFLPAALEIVETPPSPLGRTIAFTIIGLFCIALIWASLGRIDIIATATGKIVPTGRTKVVQPFETGVVRAIHVHDGQSVSANEVLVELDSTMNNAELGHLQSDLASAELDVARLMAVLEEDPLASFNPPAQASPETVATQRRFLIDQMSEQHAKLAALDQQRAEKAAARATAAATIDKLEAEIPIFQQRVDIKQQLYDRQVGSKAQYLELLQGLVEAQHELEVQKSHLQETEAALAGIVEARTQAAAEFRRTRFGELVEAERKASGLRDDVLKAQKRTKLQQLTAPVDGTVQQLAIHTEGGVVTPAQALMVIVPADSRLEIEAMLSNQDIGFVHVGQEAEIKVDTFPFTKYGLLHGTLQSISQDAISRDRPNDNARDKIQGAANSSSEPAGQELGYAARVSMDRTQMQVDHNLVNLSPGMAVTVEIQTGSRRVIEYLLSPLLRYGHDSLHER
jgi:hemolysin D